MSLTFVVLIVVVALAAALRLALRRPGADLAAEYATRLRAARAQVPGPAPAPLTADDVAALPQLVQCHLQRSGAIGKAPVRAFHIVYDAVMSQQPGQKGLPGTAEQFNAVQPVRRLFFMASRMSGLPVAVLHDYSGTAASMQVRIASLFDVANQHDAELARIETVTLLNDLCFWAPSSLIGPQFQWRVVDGSRVEVTFKNGPHTVRATLVFDAEGDLVDFISDDRAQSQRDGSFKPLRWSTPMRERREFEGRRVPTRGEAIWHRPEGPFVYGRFTVRSIRFDEAA
jgi:hypothetical protein